MSELSPAAQGAAVHAKTDRGADLMTEQQHPITPPPKLVREWAQINGEKDLERFWMRLATQAARWGADQELEACVEWLIEQGWFGSSNHKAIVDLRTARRPKPPSLAEQALTALEEVDEWAVENMRQFAIHDDLVAGVVAIRYALERLQELEKGNE